MRTTRSRRSARYSTSVTSWRSVRIPETRRSALRSSRSKPSPSRSWRSTSGSRWMSAVVDGVSRGCWGCGYVMSPPWSHRNRPAANGFPPAVVPGPAAAYREGMADVLGHEPWHPPPAATRAAGAILLVVALVVGTLVLVNNKRAADRLALAAATVSVPDPHDGDHGHRGPDYT